MFESYAERRARAEAILRERGITKPIRCEHPRSVIRFKTDALGRKAFKAQCLDCGRPVSTLLKHAEVARRAGGDLDKVKPWDEALENETYEAEQRYFRELSVLTDEILEQALTDWREEYHEYLKSPEWQQRRYLVMKRANGICEGCGMRSASQVHHLTYRNVRAEFLFELVAVCRDCHERIHGMQGE